VKVTAILICFLFSVSLCCAAVTYLDNGTIKIGVDLARGGTITYLANIADGRDIVNNYDLGREIQQSYYSGPIPFEGANWSGSDWSWNPVAAGDKCGSISEVLEWSNDGGSIYVKRIPKQWGLCNVASECIMEEWIRLEGNVAIVRCKLTNNRSDTTFYPAYNQELPAVYTNYPFRFLYSYTGDTPFTNAPLTLIANPSGNAPPWAYYNPTEYFSALVDDTNWGLGLYNPIVQLHAGGYHSNANMPASTGYIAPIRKEHLDHNIVYEYEYYLILDSLENIRNFVYAHRPDKLPNYNFAKDRQGWSFVNTRDGGFPFDGYMRVSLNSPDPIMNGPIDFWNAEDVPMIYICARYNAAAGQTAYLFWNEFNGSGFNSTKSIIFNPICDGQWHIYEIALHTKSSYTGKISQIRFDPIPSGSTGQYVDIKYISAYQIPGDFDRNWTIDLYDFAQIGNNWGKYLGPNSTGDLNDDRHVGFEDLKIFVENWLASPLVAHWKLNETTGNIVNDSVSTNDGTAFGTVWQPQENINGAISFDGSSYILVPDSDSISVGAGSFTISFWINPVSVSGLYGILTKFKDGADKEFGISTSGSSIILDIEKDDNNGRAQSVSGVLSAGTWQHIAVTFNMATKEVGFYHQGTKAATASNTITSLPDELSNDLYIGRWGGIYNAVYFRGMLDDLRIYNRVLSSSQIESLSQN